MKILLLGKNGQVGYEVKSLLEKYNELIAIDKKDLNLLDLNKVRSTIHEIRPQLIINAAAYTAVDKAESEPETARLLNGILPGVISEELKKINGALIHYSTDFVFDGNKIEAYLEDDIPNPLSIYGKTKLEGEESIKQIGIPHITIRTSWVYGTRGQNFALTMLRLAREREVLKVVDDQVGCPTWSKSLALATCDIVNQGNIDIVSFLQQYSGIYNFTSKGETTWFNFAKEILERDPNKGEQVLKELLPITTEEYPTPAKRPSYSVLNTQKIKKTFGINIINWKHYLNECFSIKEME